MIKYIYPGGGQRIYGIDASVNRHFVEVQLRKAMSRETDRAEFDKAPDNVTLRLTFEHEKDCKEFHSTLHSLSYDIEVSQATSSIPPERSHWLLP